MTATVVSLASHRRNREPACGCPRHRLEALTSRATAELAGTEGELVISRDLLAALVDDLVTTVHAALETQQGKTNP
jgi:hypothetical protein